MALEIGPEDLATGSASFRPVPGRRVYGILRALALYHWSACPWFRNEAARPGLAQDYENARRQLTLHQANAAAAVKMVVTY